jgi:predicted patatin/cPLA2 family phospholipase
MHQVLEVLQERARAGSTATRRSDRLRVALAIEGGGMRGAISAGMAHALQEAGLLGAFDAVYGSSAGAISGAWLLSSEPDRLRGWAEPGYVKTLIKASRLLRGKPIFDVENLIEVTYQTEWPMDFASVLANPIELHPLATDAATGDSTDLRPLIRDEAALRLALRASACLPLLAGPSVVLGGRRFYDAGLAESLPYRTALSQGATHVLMLRSRRAVPGFPAEAVRASRSNLLVARTTMRRETQALRDVFLSRPSRLLEDDQRLTRYQVDTNALPAVYSVMPASDAPVVTRLTREDGVIAAAFEAGREALRHALSGIADKADNSRSAG